MNVYKVPSAVFSMNIFNIAEESRFAHQYSQLLFLVNNGSFKTISSKKWPTRVLFERCERVESQGPFVLGPIICVDWDLFLDTMK